VHSRRPGRLGATATAAGDLRPGPTAETADPGLAGLADLLRFFAHPVRALLRERGGVYLREDEEQPDEQIPAALQGLERWSVGDRMLRLHLQGHDLSRLRDAEWRRGAIPPRMLGARVLGQLIEEVEEVAAMAAEFVAVDPERHEVDVLLPGIFGSPAPSSRSGTRSSPGSGSPGCPPSTDWPPGSSCWH
jgi:exodeoxyribonuclease V gamma subunit